MAVVLFGLRVERGGRREQFLIRRLCRVQPFRARRDHDRHQTLGGRLGSNHDRELRRRIRQVVRGLFRRLDAKRRPDDRGVLAAAFAGDVRLEGVVPVAVLPAQRRRPHGLQIGPELHHDFERFRRLDVEQHERALFVDRHQPRRVHRERGVGVPNARRFGTNVHGTGETGAGDRIGVLGHPERQPEIVQHLERVDPRLEAPVLAAE